MRWWMNVRQATMVCDKCKRAREWEQEREKENERMWEWESVRKRDGVVRGMIRKEKEQKREEERWKQKKKNLSWTVSSIIGGRKINTNMSQKVKFMKT